MNVRWRHFRIGCPLAGELLVLLNLAGCSSAPLVARPNQTEPTWFVRLDKYQESDKFQKLQYDHPAEWNELELATILSRLLVQPEMGLLDRKRPPVPVFTAEEILRMTPILCTAFQQAQGSEWMSFAFMYPTGTNLRSHPEPSSSRIGGCTWSSLMIEKSSTSLPWILSLSGRTPCDPYGESMDI
jgi:hypothetical protein